jgi:hypothetical protein
VEETKEVEGAPKSHTVDSVGVISDFIQMYASRNININPREDGYIIMQKAMKEGPESIAAHMFSTTRIDIQRWGCLNIGKMALNKENLKKFISSGCVVAVMRALNIYHDSSTIQSQAMIALSCISGDDDIRMYFINLDGLRLVCKALQRVDGLAVDRDEGEQNNGAAIAIHGILTLSQYYRDERIRSMAGAFGLKEIVACMRAMTGDGVVIEAAANALRYYAYNDSYLQNHAANAGAIDLLDWLYTAYQNDDPVRRAIKLALAEVEVSAKS